MRALWRTAEWPIRDTRFSGPTSCGHTSVFLAIHIPETLNLS